MTKLLEQQVESACNILCHGGVILYPTDTVWGLGCDATNEEAVQCIFRIKQRASAKSLIALVQDSVMACNYILNPPINIKDLLDNTPIPQTVIFQNPYGLAPSVISAENTCAFRAPKHLFCKILLESYGKPIVSTSANISGALTPFYFNEIDNKIFTQVDFVVDPMLEGASSHKPSRIVFVDDCGIHILRA